MINIHPQLQNDCIHIGHFPLCQLLLAKDANYPWFILVPNRNDISEIYQLSHDDQIQLISESSYFAEVLTNNFNADKINIGALGNVVPQLHIHHIARYRDDVAWPAPIWNHSSPKDYTEAQVTNIIDKLRQGLTRDFLFDVESDSDSETEG